MIKLRDLLVEASLKWKRIKRPEDLQIEYRAKLSDGSSLVISRGGRMKRVAHPLTRVMRDVPEKYWIVRWEDKQGRTSPEYYDVKASSLAVAKAKGERFAQHKNLIEFKIPSGVVPGITAKQIFQFYNRASNRDIERVSKLVWAGKKEEAAKLILQIIESPTKKQ